MKRRWAFAMLVALLVSGQDALQAQTPSFDCSKASAADERAICSNPELANLDLLISNAYRALTSRLGVKMANRIHLPFLRARHACGSNAFCVFETQISEIPSFSALGITVEPPTWIAINPPSYSDLKRMLKVGDCTAATITEVSYRLCSPDERNVCMPMSGSGSSVRLSNGIDGVSYEEVEQVSRSESGDAVIACLAEVPKDCPPGDDRGYVWEVTNQRTGESWTLPDSEHECGGA